MIEMSAKKTAAKRKSATKNIEAVTLNQSDLRIIEVPIGAPFGTIPVNTDRLSAVRPHAPAPEHATDLLIQGAGPRSILGQVPFDSVTGQLGGEFVQFTMANEARNACRLNRRLWVSINPHPQVPNVSQVNYGDNSVNVEGGVASVLEKMMRR
jgi:hypothetical protein